MNEETPNTPLIDGDKLYDGSNQPPADYLAWGLQLANTVQRVDEFGNPSPTGKMVLAALNGMSNANQEFAAFTKLFQDTYGRTRRITLFNGNRGAWDLKRIISDPNGYWHDPRGGVLTKLAKRNIHPMQVQVAWMKNSIRGLDQDKEGCADWMQAFWNEAIRTTLDYFPNLKLIFMSSAMYSGYNLKPLPRKEPQAMWEGYGVKQLIEQHIQSHREGSSTPFVGWGWYAWADGANARSDGLKWLPGDFAADKVHPGPGALIKWSTNLLKFFENNPLTKPWFVPQGNG